MDNISIEVIDIVSVTRGCPRIEYRLASPGAVHTFTSALAGRCIAPCNSEPCCAGAWVRNAPVIAPTLRLGLRENHPLYNLAHHAL
jgi:hypothetical protein